MGTMMAYSLARFRTGGSHLALWVISQRFLPPVAIILPIFLLFRTWGLYDTRIGLILAYAFMTLPLSVWMMYAYFRQLPKSLEEAALVDGLSRWQAFWMVATPLAAPGVAAAAVFVFIAVWTEFFFALILTSRYAFTLADDLSRLPRIPGRAVWRSLRARDRLARAVDRVGDAGAAASGAWADAWRFARIGHGERPNRARCTRATAPVHAVRGVDLDIPDGEFTVLVGPSGCGKSTLLRTIAGLEEADSGDIAIGGRDRQ